MPTGLAPASEAIATYAHVPRPLGREIVLTLFADALTADDRRRAVRIPLADIESVRLIYEPRNTMARGFRTRLSVVGQRNVTFASYSWRSIADAENRARQYRDFLTRLLPAIHAANPSCRFLAGRSRPVWAALVGVSAFMLVALAWLAISASQRVGTTVASLVAAFAALFAWIIVDLVIRNRPRTFAPDAPPRDLMP